MFKKKRMKIYEIFLKILKITFRIEKSFIMLFFKKKIYR